MAKLLVLALSHRNSLGNQPCSCRYLQACVLRFYLAYSLYNAWLQVDHHRLNQNFLAHQQVDIAVKSLGPF